MIWPYDFTHYRLAGGRDVEIIAWLDDRFRCVLRISAHTGVTATIVLAIFTATTSEHDCPASTRTDSGMVSTTRRTYTT